MDHKLIVVLGMHRSGTSVITRGLQVLGVNLGDTLYEAAEGNNEKGFWEDIDLNTLNVEMLNALDSDWYHLAQITSDDVDVLHKKGYFEQAVELLNLKQNGAAIFGFKDPRVAKLLPFWKKVFNYCQFDVGYVMAVRHPHSVAKSLVNRDNIDVAHSYLLWLGYVLTGLAGSVGEKLVLVDYDCLLQSPNHELGRIANALDLEVDSTELEIFINDFIDKKLRHTEYKLDDLLLDDECPELMYEIYKTLLDIVSDQLKINTPQFQDLILQWSKKFDHNKLSLSLVDKLLIKIAANNQAIAKRNEQIAKLNQTLVERNDYIEQLTSSRSWIITKPLRWLGRKLRRD